jgi:paired amphipathic helix protein Sin3a
VSLLNILVLHIRSIERIYGDKGTDVLDALYNSPAVTIPVILKRLKQKDHEWTKARREWNKIWREVNEKNYYKALDHQSFFFKQNDKKNLSPKGDNTIS